MADEHASKEEGQGPGDGTKPKGGFPFVARWRKHAASQVQPVDTPSVAPEPASGPSPGVHPNLQKQPESDSGKKFQPRWRQRAGEIESQNSAAEPGWQQDVTQPQPPPEKAGFQPRWRRTAAPSPTPEAPLEPQPKEEKGFQPKWRQRAERPSAPSPPPRAEFTPRWKRNLAESGSPAVELPAPIAAQESEPTSQPTQPEREQPGFAPVEEEVAPALSSASSEVAEPNPEPDVRMPLELTGSPAEVSLVGAANPALAEHDADLWFAVPNTEVDAAIDAAEAIAGNPATGTTGAVDAVEAVNVLGSLDTTEAVDAAGAAPEPLPTSLEAQPVASPPVASVALASAMPPALAPEPQEIEWPQAPVQEAEPFEPTPTPALVNEKRKLPRPQPPPPPKSVEIAAATTVDPSLPPDTEGSQAPLAPPSVPKASLLKFLPSPEDEVLADPEPQPPAPPEKKIPKRLDDEAIAALKATASLLTAPNRIPTPPPPPPPPPPAATPAPTSVSGPEPETPRATPSGPLPSAPSQPRYVATPIIKPSRPAPDASPQKTAAPKPKAPRREPVISTEEVATFTRQFSVMIGAGLPIHQALSFLAESNLGSLSKVIDQVATKISSGLRLSVALSHFPGVFSEVYLGLIELGETSSHIDEALGKLADLLEKQVRLAKRLQSALIYPAFLIAASMGSVGVFLQYVLPTMIPLFQSFSMTLPWPTRVLLYSRHLVWPTVITLAVMMTIWRWFQPAWIRARRRKEPWARKVDAMTMKIPLLGKLIQQITVARVLFALATMIETGLPILNALHRCESVASNLEFATRLEKAGEELRDGSTVTDALALYEVLPASCIHLISAGEESAQMAEMVQYAARYYEEEVDHSINQFMSLVEPVIMCVMGVLVAFIVLSAVLPTVEMINHLGG